MLGNPPSRVALYTLRSPKTLGKNIQFYVSDSSCGVGMELQSDREQESLVPRLAASVP